MELVLATSEDEGSSKDLYDILLSANDASPDDHLSFLAPERIIKIKNIFSDPKEKLADTKRMQELWRNVLVDAIYFLRINDYREKAFYDGQDKTTMSTGGAAKRAKADVYGIEDLCNYFAMFTEFENTLYGADKYYRDHLIHPIMVWIIGLHIIKNFGSNFKLRVCKNVEVIKKNSADESWFVDEKKYDSTPTLSTAELSAMWAIIALTHDLGYPLEKVDKINDQLEKMLAQFGKIGFSRSRFNFATQHDHLVRFLLDFISSVTKPVLEEGPSGNRYGWLTHKRTKYFTKFSKSWEMFDHGIVSSLILLKSLTYFIESDYSSDAFEKLSKEDSRQFAIRSEILHSIASHTTPKIYHLATNNLPFLLILCDELQEWSRPTLGDMRAGIKGSANKVTIKFDLEPDNSKSIIHCLVHYEDLPEVENQKKFADRIFKVWAERFRPALDDETRSIDFKWEIKFGKDQSWLFEMDTSNDVLEPFVTKGPIQDDRDAQEEYFLY